MANDALKPIYSKFLISLITAIRKISLYPANHPTVASSIKDTYSALMEILNTKKTLSLSQAQDKILLEGEPLPIQASGTSKDLVAYLKKLNIENMTFSAEITKQEIEDFIRLILLDPEQINKSGGISKMFADKDIKHIKIDIFSYVKIKKGQEAFITEERPSVLSRLKSKIKDHFSGKAAGPEDTGNIEKDIFGLISEDLKANKKISAPVKDVYEKFISHLPDQDSALSKLKGALLEMGCAVEDVEGLVNKIREDIARKTLAPEPRAKKDDLGQIKSENAQLETRVGQLQKELEETKAQIEQLQMQARRVAEEKERIDNIIHHMAEGLVVVDPQGNILMANSTAQSLLGISTGGVGTPLKEVVRDEHLLTLVKNISPTQEGVIEKDIELFSPEEATKRVLRTSSAVVEDHNGKTVGMVTILNDVTKQKEVERMKSEFVASVSHELRTPLVAMQKSLGMLIDKTVGGISETQEQFLNIADRNLKRLTILINDLLDLSKLEAGKMQIRPEPASIGKIVNESVENLNNWAKTKSVAIQQKIQEALPDLNIDPNRIVQVMTNLIGNAIKFTPANGTITVEALLSPSGREVQVSVADTGIGIPKESLDKVFEKFYQVGERTSTDIGGTGIGLSIAKEIVQLHGGRIWAESEKGSGAKFTFTLPLQ